MTAVLERWMEGLGDCPSGTGLSPSVEPPSGVSPPDGASIPIAEERVILGMAEAGTDFPYQSFRDIAERASLSREDVIPIVRSLAKRGLAILGGGLWTEDGEMYGSGYALTEPGRDLAQAIERRQTP